jgi:hypothetical protein
VDHRIVETVGLSLDIVGATLLGVEAVKIENIQRFAKWVEAQTQLALRGLRTAKLRGEESMAAYLIGFYLIGLPSVALVVTPLYAYRSSIPVWARVPMFLIGIFLVPYIVIRYIAPAILRTGLWTIEQIDGHTPTGGTGILGVIFLWTGFTLELVTTWIAP